VATISPSFFVDNYLIFQLPLGFEEISALFSKTSWLSMLMQEHGPLFSTTSWLRSEHFGPHPRGQSSVHDPGLPGNFSRLAGLEPPQGAMGGPTESVALWRFAKHRNLPASAYAWSLTLSLVLLSSEIGSPVSRHNVGYIMSNFGTIPGWGSAAVPAGAGGLDVNIPLKYG
jgi:hypothetical protein